MPLITLDRTKCQRTGHCIEVCPVSILKVNPEGYPVSQADLEPACIECGHCVAACPSQALRHTKISVASCLPISERINISTDAVAHLLRTRRSIREFKPDPVSKDLIARILDICRWAPSASNKQPTHWFLYTDPKQVRVFAGLTVDWLRSIGKWTGLVNAWKQGKDKVLRGAPHLLLACAPADNTWGKIDCATALAYLEIAAHANGLGTCWAGILERGVAESPALAAALAIPAGLTLHGGVMLGYPRHRFSRIPPRQNPKITWR